MIPNGIVVVVEDSIPAVARERLSIDSEAPERLEELVDKFGFEIQEFEEEDDATDFRLILRKVRDCESK